VALGRIFSFNLVDPCFLMLNIVKVIIKMMNANTTEHLKYLKYQIIGSKKKYPQPEKKTVIVAMTPPALLTTHLARSNES
jgi:hypothetical protein